MQKPNILLIVCDQFRSDCFSFKGHPDVLTPNLDDLAAHGVSFENAYSLVPSCIPARATLFTGQHASKHGRVGYEDGIPWDYSEMLAEQLTVGGYQSACIGKMHVHPPRKQCGFEKVELHDGYLSHYRDQKLPYYLHQAQHDDYLHFLKDKAGVDADIIQTGIDPNSRIAYPWPYAEDLHPSSWCTTRAIRFLQTRDRDKPFFLMSSYVRPHQPFDAPAAYQDIYREKSLRPPFVGDWETEERSERFGNFKDSLFGTTQEESKRRAMCGYYANITHLDSQIGRLLMALEEDGSLDDTLILFVSDHGEELFDHHLYRKAFPYQGSVHIPLIVSPGKNLGQVEQSSNSELCDLADILPTLLDFAGLDIPQHVDGLSLKELVLGKEEGARAYLHGEHAFVEQCSSQFIVSASDKYIWYSETGEEQYFKLGEDPHELHNAIHDEACQSRIAELRTRLLAELEGREEGFVVDGQLRISSKIVNQLTVF